MRGHCSRLLFQRPNRPALPRHGLKPEGVPSANPGEKKRPIRPQTQSGKSVWIGGTSPFWGERRVRRWGDDNAPKGSTQRGIPPLGDSLVTFSSGRKLPGARGGAPASVGAGTMSLHKSLPGAGRSEEPSLTTCSRRGCAPPRRWGAGATRPATSP